MQKILKKQSGFTLVELIVYLTIAAIFTVSLVTFSLNNLLGSQRTEIIGELDRNARFVLQQLNREGRQAQNIVTASSIFDSHPGSLTLQNPAGENIVFDTYTKDVEIGSVDVTIRKLRLQEGANPAIDLTTDQINVTDFTLIDYSSAPDNQSFGFEITLEYANNGNDPSRAQSLQFQSTINLRND